MRRLIVIGGCGGAGKETTGSLLYTALDSCAWIDSKWLIRVQPWEYDEPLHRLGVRNAASVANNYYAAGFTQVILSGGVASQSRLDLLLDLVEGDPLVDYVWLHADKPVRDRRRLGRQRDDADQAQYLDDVDRVFIDPGKLHVRGGRYHRLDTSALTPQQVLQAVLDLLGRGSLRLLNNSP